MKQCPKCKSNKLKNGTTTLKRTVAGTSFEATLRAKVCSQCLESYVDGDLIERFEVRAAQELARMGSMSPESFRFMRKAIGIPAVELARLLGVKPETISRWENGTRGLDRGAFALLGGLVLENASKGDRRLSRLLEALRNPVKVRSVELKVA